MVNYIIFYKRHSFYPKKLIILIYKIKLSQNFWREKTIDPMFDNKFFSVKEINKQEIY